MESDKILHQKKLKSERGKRYRLKHNEEIKLLKNKSCLCVCGCSFTHSHKNRHEKTKKHQNYLKSNDNK